MSMTVQARRCPDPVLGARLADADPEVHAVIAAEPARQESTLEMIASENVAPLPVMEAQGSVLTNPVDLRASGLDGRPAEDRLQRAGITVNRNAVPFDPRPSMVGSGVRIGTPAPAARGFGRAEFVEVADIVAAALRPTTSDAALDALRDRAAALAAAHPLYPTPRAAAEERA